jgi:uncharacterized protein
VRGRDVGRLAGAGAIRRYQRWISPLLPPSCRFSPSCSEYAAGAVERFGLVHGGWLALRRLLRCHPFHPGGYDPVPDARTRPSEGTSPRDARAPERRADIGRPEVV